MWGCIFSAVGRNRTAAALSAGQLLSGLRGASPGLAGPVAGGLRRLEHVLVLGRQTARRPRPRRQPFDVFPGQPVAREPFEKLHECINDLGNSRCKTAKLKKHERDPFSQAWSRRRSQGFNVAGTEAAQNLHNNPHFLIIPHISPAKRDPMLGSWGKSSPSTSDDRDCLDGCSTTAGGCKRRPPAAR